MPDLHDPYPSEDLWLDHDGNLVERRLVDCERRQEVNPYHDL